METTKKEIIKFLDKEVRLFNITENENSLGELYITEMQFKKIDDVIRQLQDKRKLANEFTDKLREIVNGNDRFDVWQNTDKRFDNKIINVKMPLIILDGKNLINNCSFINTDKITQ